MSKRGAVKQLTQDNFDQSDEEDDDPTNGPKVASEEELKKRVIKTGKRRLGGSNGQPSPNVFAGFAGFGGMAAAPKETAAAKPSFNFASSTPAPKPAELSNPATASTNNLQPDPEETFRGKVKTLNTQFLKWAREQVDQKSGVVDLTPCMKDYQKHIDELRNKLEEDKAKSKPAAPATSSAPISTFKFGAESTKTSEPPATSSTSSSGSFLFGSSKPEAGFSVAPSKPSTETKPSSGFSFGLPTSTTTAPTLSFGNAVSDKPTSTTVNPLLGGTSTSTFSFGSKPSETAITFSFGLKPGGAPAPGFFGATSASAQEAKEKNEEEEGEDEEQEKYEKKDIKEDDAFFEVRTKLFYLAGKEFKSRGIGNIFLKRSGGKVQMIVRADNNLGTVLLNIFVKNVAPKMDAKTSVSMWCVPNPPLEPKSAEAGKPTKFLFKVKDEASAQQLLEHLEKES